MTKTVQFKLNNKQTRIVWRCLQELFSKRALEPLTVERWRETDLFEILHRRVKVSSEGREALMSNAASAAYRRVVDVFAEASSSNKLCTRSDVEKAIREVYEISWQNGKVPTNAEELVAWVCGRIKLDEHTIVAAMRGVELEGIQEVQLGKLRLVASVKDLVTEACVGDETDFKKSSVQRLMNAPCLVGSWTGTLEAARRWYREQAFLAAGMLAVEAGASYMRGPSSFHIAPEFERPSSNAGSSYLYWNDREKHLGRSFSFERGQNFSLSAERVIEVTKDGTFEHALEIFQKHDRTKLEDAITRAVYWYGDAHRDSVHVMQFIKYWSCLECLLGGTGEELTETLALSIVTVLSFGHYRRLEVPEWEENVRTVKRLYALRSRAVHRASHSHVEFQDVVILGTWAAWVIYNTVSFSQAGMYDLKTLWERLRQVASEHEREGVISAPGTSS